MRIGARFPKLPNVLLVLLYVALENFVAAVALILLLVMVWDHLD